MIRRGRRPLKRALHALLGGLALCAAPVSAQDEVVVTGMRIATGNSLSPVALAPPVVGLRRQADSAVRTIEIVSDSREDDMRRSEVAAMLRAAIDRAARDGVTLVTGEYELVEVTRDNWQDQFPGLAGSDEQAADEDDDDYDDYDDEDDAPPPPAFEDDGSTLRVRLKVKTSLDGSVDNAQRKITAFVRTVAVTGRSQIEQRGGLALTIIKPEQYRDAIYGRIAEAAKAALAFYGADYGLEVTGLDSAIEWQQVSNTEVFLFIRYHFTVRK
jgi:hypothetical protein